MEYNQQEYIKMNTVGQACFCVAFSKSFGTQIMNNMRFSESVILFFQDNVLIGFCSKYTCNHAKDRYQREKSEKYFDIFHLLCCEWSSIFTFSEVNTRRKLIFTVGEGTSASRMLCNNRISDDLVDQFKRRFRWLFLY